ncbi:hypothetical protein L3Q82_023726, partial [Scortum barcoo]
MFSRRPELKKCQAEMWGTMVMLKISAFLVAYALVICQMYCSQAAPARPGLESMSDRVTLTDYEARRLLNAIVKEFVQMTAEELEQQATEGNSMERPLTKRCSNLSTCVLGKLSQELHKLQTFPRTNVGAGTPGKKRSAPESDSYASYGRDQRYSTEASLQHGNLRDSPLGGLPQPIGGNGQQQLRPHQRRRQGFRQAEEKRPDVSAPKPSGK